ncbi:MAG: hypothetical protein AAF585_11405 [Verrucomicrobiota bacterium]
MLRVFQFGALLALIFAVSAAAEENRKTLAEWALLFEKERDHWQRSGMGSHNDYVKDLTAKAEKGDASAAFRLGANELKFGDDPFAAWQWFRKAGGDDHPLTQLALGRVYLTLNREYDYHIDRREILQALNKLEPSSVAALKAAITQEEDVRLRIRAHAALNHVLRD